MIYSIYPHTSHDKELDMSAQAAVDMNEFLSLGYSAQKIMRKISDVDQRDHYKHIRDSIIRGQRCQRNWDLTKELTQEQIDLILTSVTQCPTKQNNQYYSVAATTDRELIEAVHETTYFESKGNYATDIPNHERTNPQVLAQLLLVFTHHELEEFKNEEQYVALHDPESTTLSGFEEKDAIAKAKRIIEEDRIQAIGVAAGHSTLTASLIGLQTGCCKCFDRKKVQELFHLSEEPLLLMGIGYGDPSRRRREHHVNGMYIGSESKKIDIHWR